MSARPRSAPGGHYCVTRVAVSPRPIVGGPDTDSVRARFGPFTPRTDHLVLFNPAVEI